MSAHMLSAEQITELRAGTREIARVAGLSLRDAWMAMYTPDYVWVVVGAARNAAGQPRARYDMFDPVSGTFIDLLAADTPERDAAAKAMWDAITEAVVAV